LAYLGNDAHVAVFLTLSNNQGKIIKSVAGSCLVRFSDGEIIKCKLRGKLRLGALRPLAGDEVCVGEEGESAVVTEILSRRNTLVRPAVANVDTLLITIAPAQPAPTLSIIDKVIAVAEYNDIQPVIVVSKSDVDNAKAIEIAELYRGCGMKVFVTSAESGDGLAELSAYLDETAKEQTVIFCGSSGVGKSSLMNAIFPRLAIAVGALSEKSERGRHTTREVALYSAAELLDPAMSGYIGDTPGFSLVDFDLIDIFDVSKLPFGFREMVPYLGECKYTKCTHVTEDGCAVIQAVDQGKIHPLRYQSYLGIYEEIKDKKDWMKK